MVLKTFKQKSKTQQPTKHLKLLLILPVILFYSIPNYTNNLKSLQDSYTKKDITIDGSISYNNKSNSKAGLVNGGVTKNSYKAVTNQSSITGAKVTINTKDNTNIKGALIKGDKSTSINTKTLTYKDIKNSADYKNINVGIVGSGDEN